jgi:hypothetical protein
MHVLQRMLLIVSFLTWSTCAANPYLVGLTLTSSDESIAAAVLASEVLDAVVLIDDGAQTNDAVTFAAQSAGDRLILKHMEWPGNISEAWNAALRVAAGVGASWGVFIDTTERVEAHTSHVRDYLKQTGADVVNMISQSCKPPFKVS